MSRKNGVGANLAGIILGPPPGAADRAIEYQRYLAKQKRSNVFAKAALLDAKARILHVGDESQERNEVAAVAYGLAREALRLSERCDDTAIAAVGIAYRCALWCRWKNEAVDVLKMFGRMAST